VRRLNPFVVGHLIGAVVVGLAAGAMLGVPAAFFSAAGLAVGALVSCLICRVWPGLDAKARFLWPVAVLGNPVTLMALVMVVAEGRCLTDDYPGWDCMAVAVAAVVAGLGLLPPLGGLLWRRWKRAGLV
jgi:hypothetical protein